MINKPTFFIVGAAKAGTTTLHHILAQHPEIYMSPIKEPNYFCKDILVANFNDFMKSKFLSRGVEFDGDNNIIERHQAYVSDENEYFKLFNAVENEKAVGEASVSYLFSERAALEIHKCLPAAKIIMILRNPVERAFSHYLMDLKVGGGLGVLGFIGAINKDYNRKEKGWGKSQLYIELGMYYQQVKRYQDVFGSDQVKVVLFDDFQLDPQRVIKDIHDFLGVSSSGSSFEQSRKNRASVPRNRISSLLLRKGTLKLRAAKLLPKSLKNFVRSLLLTSKKLPVLTDSDKKIMLEYYNQDLLKLQKIINKDLSHWLR